MILVGVILYFLVGTVYAVAHHDPEEGDTALDFFVDLLLWPVFLIVVAIRNR